MDKERSERLTCRPLEANVDRIVGQTFLTISFGNFSREHCSCGTVGISDGIVHCNFLLGIQRLRCRCQHLSVEHCALHAQWNCWLLYIAYKVHHTFFLVQKTTEVKHRCIGLYEVGTTNNVIE